MRTYFVAFFLAAAVVLVLTPLVRRFAPGFGAVDLPSGRRVNKKVIPRLGGIGILIGFLVPLVGLFFYSNAISSVFIADMNKAAGLLLGAVAMALLGAHDDLKGSRAWKKLIVQVAVAVAAYYAGFQIDHINLPFIGMIRMGVFALPVTVLWIVGIINALNLIDGLDGLACGVAFFVCVVNFTIGALSANLLVSLFAATLGGALLGFLIFNFNPATIFMGDSGSMFIGYVLATSALLGTKGSTAVGLLVPILALGLPIMDTLLAIVRRVVGRQPIFAADRRHLHHRLVDMGMTHRKAVMVLYGVSVLFTIAAIGVYLSRTDWQTGVVLLVASVMVVGLMRATGNFQLRRLKRDQRERTYADDTQRLRHAVPQAIAALRQASGPDEVKVALEEFGESAALVFIDSNTPSLPELDGWTWENGQGSGPKTLDKKGRVRVARGYISATFPLRPNGPEPGPEPGPDKIKFGWYTDSGEVSRQNEVLLQLVVDEVGRGC